MTKKANELKYWAKVFNTVMWEDGSAPASILGYYLDNIKGYDSIFCPLGCYEYEVLGHEIRNNPVAFKAALNTGLMQSAINTHLGAALDVWENWDCMREGVLHLMMDSRLSVFIPYEERICIKQLKSLGGNEEDEELWYAMRDRQNQERPSEFRGY